MTQSITSSFVEMIVASSIDLPNVCFIAHAYCVHCVSIRAQGNHNVFSTHGSRYSFAGKLCSTVILKLEHTTYLCFDTANVPLELAYYNTTWHLIKM